MPLNITEPEAQLLRAALINWQARLNNNSCESHAHKHAGTYVYGRCELLINKIDVVIAGFKP